MGLLNQQQTSNNPGSVLALANNNKESDITRRFSWVYKVLRGYESGISRL